MFNCALKTSILLHFFFCIFQDEKTVSKKLIIYFYHFFLSFSFSLVCVIPEREQFDQQIRSHNIDPDSPTFRLITDGQLPLRQCLHPEACAKDIELPNYFCKFSDLRKEYVRFKSGDLSRALVAIKDVPNMPALPAQPTCIADMIAGT